MISRVLYDKEKNDYNRLAYHPVQTWEWGEFQLSQGHKVFRVGQFDNQKLVKVYTVIFHKLPKTNFTVGTIQRGPNIDEDMLLEVEKLGLEQNAIYIKFEPDVYYDQPYNFPHLKISPKVNFYPYSHVIDLTKSEDELLASMHPKTRYNIKIANRNNVQVVEDNSDTGFEMYLKLLFDTTRRQGFYLHSEKYHRQLWKILKSTGMVHVMLASWNNQILSAFMLFTLKDRLFYPYGASLDIHREVQAPTLLMWECIKLGKSLGLKSFDMWGSLGPNARESDPSFGFHRFKQGFGGDLKQFVGTYDLVINPNMYRLYNTIDHYRWQLLRFKADLVQKINRLIP